MFLRNFLKRNSSYSAFVSRYYKSLKYALKIADTMTKVDIIKKKFKCCFATKFTIKWDNLISDLQLILFII